MVALGKKWSRLENNGRFFGRPIRTLPDDKKPPINNNFSALKGHPSGNTASEYRTYRLPLGKKWSWLEKSGRGWKKVVVVGKMWSWLEKSGHFLEKSGIDVFSTAALALSVAFPVDIHRIFLAGNIVLTLLEF